MRETSDSEVCPVHSVWCTVNSYIAAGGERGGRQAGENAGAHLSGCEHPTRKSLYEINRTENPSPLHSSQQLILCLYKVSARQSSINSRFLFVRASSRFCSIGTVSSAISMYCD